MHEDDYEGYAGFEFAGLLVEIYRALHGGQHRLAAMGIRALTR
jgi:hypothetical protein